jgi:C1A family cysteine protease
MLIYSSFEGEDVAKTGMVPMPSKSDQILGGHALLAIGYCDEKQCFIVRNSWGSSWGDKGYCYIPYNYLVNSNLASDFWIITQMSS